MATGLLRLWGSIPAIRSDMSEAGVDVSGDELYIHPYANANKTNTKRNDPLSSRPLAFTCPSIRAKQFLHLGVRGSWLVL
jgi:hypothetical protein